MTRLRPPWSIRARLVLAAAVVLLAFLAGAGWAVQQSHADSVRAQRFARLQATVYLLMAAAELDPQGALVLPTALAEPRLTLPGSGLYGQIRDLDGHQTWQSASALGLNPPFQGATQPGQWAFDTLAGTPEQRGYLSASTVVTWSVGEQATPLLFSVLEDKAAFDQELQAFVRTLWRWLGGTGLLLLASQTLLLRWGLRPLQRMAEEVVHIEQGHQTQIQGHYPPELAGLTGSLNLLMAQERARQTRYKEALDDLAHSLKTPLAVLRATLTDPTELPQRVAEQVARMDTIVVHQLGRAAASGTASFAPLLALAPVLTRIGDSLAKIYADKALQFELSCPPDLQWRMAEGDAFELLGNLLDNAAKWARQRVSARIGLQGGQLHICITDDGPGFADPQAVLQRRVRLDEQVPGHGIGLAVVRDLVASHGGTLHITHAPSGGAQLEVLLPG